ncbi:MAG: hypothetical protein A2Y33_08915 [Spirochaetes bacterium GWF1_51_8]|nr:MAG: hypothetical protein A2Y33_08915 [Spirochaetes bacterium GWF1_51_8]
MLIDSHTHLRHTYSPEELSAFLSNPPDDLGYLVEISTNNDEILTSAALRGVPWLLHAAGLYPENAALFGTKMRGEFLSLIERFPPHAIGEVGLDYHWDYAGAPEQEKLFRFNIETAIARNIPLLIHSRDAFDDTFRILKDYALKIPVVFHCFGYGPDEAEKLIPEGYYLSFAGNITYSKAEPLRAAARLVPHDRLLLETDAPYLSPIPNRGKKNCPEYVGITYRYVSELLGLDFDSLSAQIERNFRKVFGI